jgi:ankyrin repeat protein
MDIFVRLFVEKDDIKKNDILKEYIEKGGEIDAVRKEDGVTLLHICSRRNHLLVNTMICAHVSLNVIDNEKRTPLFYAVLSNSIDNVRSLIENGAVIDITDISGNTPLHYAIMNDNIDIVRFFISQGCDVNIANNDYLTPLMLACKNDRSIHYCEMIKMLVDAGSDVDIEVSGCKPVQLMTFVDNNELVTAMIKNNKNIDSEENRKLFDVLHYLGHHGLDEAINVLIEHEYNFNVRRIMNSQSPLHASALYGHFTTVKLLVEKGNADVNITDYYGKTPYDYAHDIGNTEIAEYLLSKSNS